MIDGLVEHLETFLGEIAGAWDTDPDGNDLPFQIVHYTGGAPAGAEVFSTLGLSDHPLGDAGSRIELLMIVPAGLTIGTVPPILHAAGLFPVEADDVPLLGDTYADIDGLEEISPMTDLYVGRPLYQPPEFNPFDNGAERVVFWWLVPIYPVEAEFVESNGWEAFERLMWELDVDPTDLARDPWID